MQCIVVKSGEFENSYSLLYILLKSCLCCCSLAPQQLLTYCYYADIATSRDSFVSACAKTKTLDPWNPGTPEHLNTPEYQT